MLKIFSVLECGRTSTTSSWCQFTAPVIRLIDGTHQLFVIAVMGHPRVEVARSFSAVVLKQFHFINRSLGILDTRFRFLYLAYVTLIKLCLS